MKKEFERLRKWSEALNRKRGTLKTELQIKAFNEEAAHPKEAGETPYCRFFLAQL